MVCLESVQYSIMEGAPPQTLNVDLTCGNVGEFTLSMTASTNGTNTDSTATGNRDVILHLQRLR